MEKKENEIINPPALLTINLFLLMLLGIWVGYESTSAIPLLWNDALYPTFQWVILDCANVLASIYTLYGIYRVLQHKPYSIVIIKCTSIYMLLAFTMNVFFFMYIPKLLGWIILLWLLCFCIYLFKSKKVKRYIPERSFGVHGILGILLFIAVIATYAYYGYTYIQKDNNSTPISMSEIDVKNNDEFTDGLIAFKVPNDWAKDTIFLDKENENQFFIFKTKRKEKIMVTSIISQEIYNIIDYYLLISNQLINIEENAPLKEIEYKKVILDNGAMYSNTYELGKDSIQEFLMTALLCDKKSNKKCISLVKSPKRPSYQDINTLMKSVDFNLKERFVK